VPVAATGTGGGRIGTTGGERQLLLDVAAAGSGQTAAMALRLVGLLLLIVLMWFCFTVIKGRRPETPAWVPYVGALAVMLLAINTALGFHEVKDIASTYVASGSRTPERAKQLLDDSSLLRGTPANLARLGMNALFGLWLGMVCLDMIRVGLLTRFLGYFGFAAAVTTAIGFPAGDALFFGWLGSVGILALGYWPGGRPPAWEAGRAIPADDDGPRPMRPQKEGSA
jgi:hypothetical protein